MKLDELNNLFTHFIPWLSSQFDRDTGGFYYASSSIDPGEFKPDLESSAQAVSILEMTGLLAKVPVRTKDKMISFFQKRQTEKGYFLDPHNEMHTIDRMVARAISYSVNSLSRLGSTPLYAPPGSNGGELPGHMQSLSNFQQWLEERPWDNAWMACDNISAAIVYLRSMADDQSQLFLDYLLPWLEMKQDGDTGMWGDGRPFIKLSGAFKLCLFYRKMNLPMPKADRIFDYLLETLKTDIAEDFCWVRNPVDLLSVLLEQIPQPEKAILDQIYKTTLENMSVFLKNDGGFSRGRENSLAMPNNQILGKGLAEGDMNAGTQAIRIRMLFHKIYGIKEDELNNSHLIESLGMEKENNK
jgi:hypothetical protein